MGKSVSPPSVLLGRSIAQFILLFPHFSPFYWLMFSFGARRYFYCFGFCDMFLFWLRSAEHARISWTSAQFAFTSPWCSSVIRPKSLRWPSSTSSLRFLSSRQQMERELSFWGAVWKFKIHLQWHPKVWDHTEIS